MLAQKNNDITEWYYDELYKMSEFSPFKINRMCSIDCSFCCSGAIIVPFSEIIYIVNILRLRIVDNLQNKLEDYLNKLSVSENHFEHKIPCVFLEYGRCLIYDFRPSVCRKYFSTNREFCFKDKKLSMFIDKYCMDSGKRLLMVYVSKLSENNLPNKLVDFHVGVSHLLFNNKKGDSYMDEQFEEILVANEELSNKSQEKEPIVEKAISLEECQYERNFGLTQCGCAT